MIQQLRAGKSEQGMHESMTVFSRVGLSASLYLIRECRIKKNDGGRCNGVDCHEYMHIYPLLGMSEFLTRFTGLKEKHGSLRNIIEVSRTGKVSGSMKRDREKKGRKKKKTGGNSFVFPNLESDEDSPDDGRTLDELLYEGD